MDRPFLVLFKWDTPRTNLRTGRVNKWVPKENGGVVKVWTPDFLVAVRVAKGYAPEGSKAKAIDHWPNGSSQPRVRIYL
jgi:hypothetical protein